MSINFACQLWGVSVLFFLPMATLCAQPTGTVSGSQLPEIANEPKTIDPAVLMPSKLAASATHDFSDSSLREVVAWLQDERGLVVLVDNNALSEIGVSPAEPISDRLTDDPVYLLLNRLRSLGLAWYYEDEILYITSSELAEKRATTLPYNVGDLLDVGYKLDILETVITSTIAPDSWEQVGGEGVLNSLGDVMFVRQNEELQRQIKALLAALGSYARQTFVNDPPQHLNLREKLKDNLSVDFLDTPLETAIGQVAQLARIDIRLDIPALRNVRVREREPVMLKLANRQLATVLQAIVLNLDLTKDVSDDGVGVVLHQPIHARQVVIGLWLAEEDRPWFFRGEVRQNSPIGGGYWVIGVQLTEVLNVTVPQQESLFPLAKQLLPAELPCRPSELLNG